uniref:Glycosyltransferase n=1 Tax=viral metagenome TaxID=1070528 RepID=A0A6C0DAW2_9ZZZZ
MNIIQTWKTNEIPIYYIEFVTKIKNLNPNWNYMFFDDNDIIAFMKYTTPEYYETFLNLTGKIQQIDFFRYVAIYYYGGMYLDLDIDIVCGFDDIDLQKCLFPIESKNPVDEILASQSAHLVGNYAFYAPKGCVFLKKIIDNIVNQRIPDETILAAQKNHTDDSRDVYVYYRTGPILVSQTYIDFGLSDNSVMLIEPCPYMDNCFGKYGYHRCYGSWRHAHNIQTPM